MQITTGRCCSARHVEGSRALKYELASGICMCRGRKKGKLGVFSTCLCQGALLGSLTFLFMAKCIMRRPTLPRALIISTSRPSDSPLIARRTFAIQTVPRRDDTQRTAIIISMAVDEGRDGVSSSRGPTHFARSHRKQSSLGLSKRLSK